MIKPILEQLLIPIVVGVIVSVIVERILKSIKNIHKTNEQMEKVIGGKVTVKELKNELVDKKVIDWLANQNDNDSVEEL
jgi:uncharacterized membrane-anchored protein YhcB (DUF1043 family)